MTTYDSAVAAESEGKYHDALRLYQSILSNNDDTTSKKKQIQTDIQRVINIMYGPKGSDETICVWKNSPLLSKTKPPPLQFRASCQVGNKIYVHGGCDFCENDCVPSSDDVWQYNTTLTIENGPSFQLVWWIVAWSTNGAYHVRLEGGSVLMGGDARKEEYLPHVL